ncbi:hypothetical protein [Janibacter anophelis]|nr:hypothetical protein [Janibacter anophelis]
MLHDVVLEFHRGPVEGAGRGSRLALHPLANEVLVVIGQHRAHENS